METGFTHVSYRGMVERSPLFSAGGPDPIKVRALKMLSCKMNSRWKVLIKILMGSYMKVNLELTLQVRKTELKRPYL